MVEIKQDSENIKFHIDRVNYIKEYKKVIISGWMFSDSEIDIEILYKYAKKNKINKVKREDVAEHFNLKDSEVGFDLEMSLDKTSSLLPLKFYTVNDAAIVKIKLFNRPKIFSKKSLFDFYCFSKQKGIFNAIKHGIDLIFNGPTSMESSTLDINQQYEIFLERQPKFELKNECFEYNPLISILIPVYNVSEKWLRICLDSVLNQTYKNWELCVVDDASPSDHIKTVLEEYAKKDKRVKYSIRKQNGHISVASNDALSLASGEYIALLDNDDELSINALAEVIRLLNQNKMLDLIYTDEDKIDEKGNRFDPHFKTDWAPDTFMSMNYICHFTVLRKNIVEEVGGFRLGYEGAQDYDLFLRVTEKTQKIAHIPQILYHWRALDTSTAKSLGSKNYSYIAGKKALEDALRRRNISGKVVEENNIYSIEYSVTGKDKVSIIIPTKDQSETLDVCLNSIFQKTTYPSFEIIVVNNNSIEPETFALFEKYKMKYDNFKVMENNIKFNYSKLNNDAVKLAEGKYIVLLNNDIEVITPNWLELMLGYAQLEHIGAVGAKLLYPDDTVQHCGVILGIGGVAGHTHKYATRQDLGYYARLAVPYNYSAVTAACLMVKKSKFLEVDGLEEKLEVAFNDVDFNIKLLKEGYYNIVLPKVQLYHYESKSRGHEDTPEKINRFNKEMNFMKNKWSHILEKDRFYNDNFSLDYEQIKLIVSKEEE